MRFTMTEMPFTDSRLEGSLTSIALKFDAKFHRIRILQHHMCTPDMCTIPLLQGSPQQGIIAPLQMPPEPVSLACPRAPL